MAQRARNGSGNPAKTKVVPVPVATARDWIAAARLRTLLLAISPVVLGTGAGIAENGAGRWDPWLAVLCLVTVLCLQIGVNFANDYSDGIRGTDAFRVGPARLTGSGAAPPRQVLTVALSFFAAAAIAGLAITVMTQQWWFVAVGVAAIAAAWFYTGGKRPYGYYGFGELAVFVFFGLVATIGSAYVQSFQVSTESWLGGVGLGLIACAVLVANNLRDIEQDRAAGKKTLAVLVGPIVSRILYGLFLVIPFGFAFFFALLYPLGLFVFFGLLVALPAVLIVATAKTSRELLLALQLASITSLIYGVVLGLAFAL